MWKDLKDLKIGEAAGSVDTLRDYLLALFFFFLGLT